MEEKNNLTAERSLEIITEQIERLCRRIFAIYRLPVEESWRAGVEYALGRIMVDRICRQLAH